MVLSENISDNRGFRPRPNADGWFMPRPKADGCTRENLATVVLSAIIPPLSRTFRHCHEPSATVTVPLKDRYLHITLIHTLSAPASPSSAISSSSSS